MTFLIKPLMLGLLLTACNNGEFSRAQPEKVSLDAEPEDKQDFTFEAPCTVDEERESTFEFEIDGSKAGNIVTIQGSICQSKLDKVIKKPRNIFFSIDFSGSMEKIDPQVGATCKRLEAATALVRVLEEKFDDPNIVRMSAISFGVSSTTLVDNVSLDIFKTQYLKPYIFCSFLIENTNYEASFKRLTNLVSKLDEKEEKHIYMITDGLPTLDDAGTRCRGGITGEDEISPLCKSAGADAAKELKGLTKNLNVLFLSDVTDPLTSESSRQYLVNEIAGSAARVKYADDAASAAQQIRDFETPQAAVFGELSAKGRIDGLKDEYEVIMSKKSDLKWDFSTEIELPGEEGTYVLVINPEENGVAATDQDITISLKVSLPHKDSSDDD